ncbi:MAG: guanylate kinase [Dehalococcoidia bacterium]|nr:guanylate kinase [Dehalococcoidia bacterium]
MEVVQSHLYPHPQLIVISGPSGVGKDSIIDLMKQRQRPYYFCVTATTRAKRPNEVDGVHYQFMTREIFEQMLGGGDFLEHAFVYGNWYGVPKPQIRHALADGKDVILKVDVQGAATIKRLVPNAVFIFVAPGSMADLAKRLQARKTESSTDMDLRLKTAEAEMKELIKFDYLVMNPDSGLDQCVSVIEAIISAERSKVEPRVIKL